jgi:uncharacterized protein YqeY
VLSRKEVDEAQKIVDNIIKDIGKGPATEQVEVLKSFSRIFAMSSTIINKMISNRDEAIAEYENMTRH